MPLWRNWQTRWTQNPVPFTGSVGSTPTGGIVAPLEGLFFYKKFLLLDYQIGNPSTGKSIEPRKQHDTKNYENKKNNSKEKYVPEKYV